MARLATIENLTTVITLVAAVSVAVLYATEHAQWQTALAVVVTLLCVRILVMAWAASCRALPWSRLLLPAIVLIEGVGLGWSNSSALWPVRVGTAIALEIGFVAIAVRELRRSATPSDETLEARVARAITALLPPRVARLVAFELVVVGSAVRFLAGGWRRAVPPGFSYHRESGLRMLLPMLPLLAIGDVLLLELVLLPRTEPWVRAVVHVLAIYGLVWIVGVYGSVRARPHQVRDGILTLHRGILGRLSVPVTQIASIEKLPVFTDDWKQRAYCKGAIRLDVAGAPVLELRLHSAVRPIRVLGDGPSSTRVLVAVDDPDSLTSALGI